MTIDKDSNVYICGSFKGIYNIGTFALTSNGLEDAFVIKYDKYNNVVWANNFGGDSVDKASGINIDTIGNIYITGLYSKHSTFFNDSLIASNFCDIFLIKIDSNYNLVWKKDIKTVYDERSFYKSLKIKNNNIYLVATIGSGFLASIIDTVLIENMPYTFHGNGDAFIINYNLDGQLKWVQTLSGYGSKGFAELESDEENNVYLTGSFSSAASLGGNIIDNLNNYGADFFIAKLDSSSNVIWIKTAGINAWSTDKYVGGSSLAVDKNKNVYGLVFVNKGPTNLYFGTNVQPIIAGQRFSVLVKYDSMGNYLWSKQIGDNYISAFRLGVDSTNLYITGSYEGYLPMDADTLRDTSPSSMFVARYDFNGNELCATQSKRKGGEYGTCITVLDSANIYVAGWVGADTTYFDSLLVYNQVPGKEMFFGKLHYDSTKVIKTYGNPNATTNNLNVATIKYFPNPANTSITVEFAINTCNQLELLDVAGKVISTYTIPKNKTSININTSLIQNGIYFLKVQYQQQSQLQKIIIQH
jgi:hypothetical protein